MSEVKLLGTQSSFPCARIIWALKLKEVEYEFIEEDLFNKSPLLLKMNPVYKKVPVLIHIDKPVVESLVILEYIDETWKHNPLLPEDPYERATARFWAKFVDEKCVLSAWEAVKSEGENKKKAIETAQEMFEHLEKQIAGKKYFGGEKIGYLDLVIGWTSLWLNAMEEVGGMKLLVPEKFPSLSEWTQNFIRVPAIQDSLPPLENVVNYFQVGLNYLRSLSANKS
ncbi:probable glutathione S-transferase isoform X2 [Olea europaea var. sylvestris]|uniref:probable glutathione S-transferase isoform X1 n=1 Tax=Olea europaea var. sylvestris TaxID=158386 RepID=UPI000C1CF4C6|nr:probable glutathione S-transferase isoform X1 [Olea europaea var. sylvestris]XP_022850044.1 probable glutathione S-transferase isoform X2 [Olea europaea var. sylvestris]